VPVTALLPGRRLGWSARAWRPSASRN